jgi:Protein of unknown function DUF86
MSPNISIDRKLVPEFCRQNGVRRLAVSGPRCARLRQAARNHGEAAGRVPPEEQARRPSVPWSSIVGLRNRLIHRYDDIDHDIVWQIVTVDLPAVVVELSLSIPNRHETTTMVK